MSGSERQQVLRVRRRRIRVNSKSRVITRPQRHYCDQADVLVKIFEDIDKKMGLKAISVKYRCALSTLYRWKKRRQEQHDWMPNKDRTARNRIFTEDEERQIAEEICGVYLNQGLLLRLQVMAMRCGFRRPDSGKQKHQRITKRVCSHAITEMSLFAQSACWFTIDHHRFYISIVFYSMYR